MSKLLRADFVRLFKSKIFWLAMIFMAGLASFASWTKWQDSQDFPDHYNPPDGILLAGAGFIGIVMAVVIGVFIGTDYSNGTIRNKHVIGHSRTAMYFSNLIICVTAAEMIHIAYLTIIIGASVLGITREFEMSAGNIAALLLTSVFTVAALTSVFVLVSMLISSRTAGSVTLIILSLALIIAANTIHYRLLEKEYTKPYSYTITNEYGEEVEIEQESVKNPKYLMGTKRKIYQFFDDILPNNQIMQMTEDYEDDLPDHTAYFPVYSLVLIAVTTGAGVLLFRRKDLK